MDPAAREYIAGAWDRAWSEGLWAAAWGKSVEGLSSAQAAWSPGEGRNSIWQIVLHMVFWREYALRRAEGGDVLPDDEIARRNFPRITEVTEEAWAEARRQFEASHRRVAQGLRNPSESYDRLASLLGHDAYHVGQINYLRAMQGLAPIE